MALLYGSEFWVPPDRGLGPGLVPVRSRRMAREMLADYSGDRRSLPDQWRAGLAWVQGRSQAQ
ncbi:hypothetical protein [Prochlorothrix hollandica]|uniref:hypothetical protein n=1 Tax=Prochlorothrix hollandica TaxID=1223 RepID=UPI00034DD8F9|nr:hypothetical protein [Prochlorothrix hollandica]